MGKIIVSQEMLGTKNFFVTAMTLANDICEKNKVPKEEVQKIAEEINSAPNLKEFKNIYEKYFGKEVKIKINE